MNTVCARHPDRTAVARWVLKPSNDSSRGSRTFGVCARCHNIVSQLYAREREPQGADLIRTS